MKKSVRMVSAAAVLAVLAIGAAALSNIYISKSQTRIDRAVSEYPGIASTVREAAAVRKTTSDLPKGWEGLSFDEQTEIKRIVDDLGNDRGYSVDARRDPAAAQVQKDITAAVKKLATSKKKLTEADKRVTAALRLRLPAADRTRTEKLKKDVENEKRLVAANISDLEQLRHDNDVWGFLALTLASNQLLLENLAQAERALAANDYALTGERAATASQSVDESATFLSMARQELSNISVQSEDAGILLSFISKGKDAASAYGQFQTLAVTSNENQITQARTLANERHAALTSFAEKSTIGQGYKAWFLGRANSRL